jgi:hypothetical protein
MVAGEINLRVHYAIECGIYLYRGKLQKSFGADIWSKVQDVL